MALVRRKGTNRHFGAGFLRFIGNFRTERHDASFQMIVPNNSDDNKSVVLEVSRAEAELLYTALASFIARDEKPNWRDKEVSEGYIFEVASEAVRVNNWRRFTAVKVDKPKGL